MTDKQIKEIYKLADVLETITNNEVDLFESEIKVGGQTFKVELEPLEYAQVVAKGVSNALIEVVNMEDEE
ncbi:hypothetical protein [Macrococcus epidermidis]|uniref:hypothetical protein n=1 Tax=Macrococcus epidermidis TaxID=1902580 RepID=UPI0020B89827|nr:hypothetical protein [Macrococcus epidermidis]UTH16959.1 hypothetical protein KFV12_04085 [Macrococcus epidermidis]